MPAAQRKGAHWPPSKSGSIRFQSVRPDTGCRTVVAPPCARSIAGNLRGMARGGQLRDAILRMWVWIWALWAIAAGCAQAQNGGGCPLDYSSLDFSAAVSACTEPSGLQNCCAYVRALFGVAMAEYTNATALLTLPGSLAAPCLDATVRVFEENGIAAAQTNQCGLRTVNGSYNIACQNYTIGPSISELGGFGSVLNECVGNTTSSCSSCFDASKEFVETTLGASNANETACLDATFLTVASLGGVEYAMETANCFYKLQNAGGQLQPQSECHFSFPAWQIQNVANACQDSTNGDCCAAALLALRTGATQNGGAFLLSKKQGTACIAELTDNLKGQDSALDAFVKCNMTASSIFQQTTSGCHHLLTSAQLIQGITAQGLSFIDVENTCKEANFSCNRCQAAVDNVTYAVAAPDVDPQTIQSCRDLVFMALAGASSAAEATSLGGCLYSLPVITSTQQIVAPAPAPAEAPVIESQPNNSIITVVSESHATKLTLVLGIGIGVAAAALAVLCLLLLLIHQKRKELRNTSPDTPVWKAKEGLISPRYQIQNWRKDSSPLFKRYKLHEVKTATKNFSDVIGRGGFGTVYKGQFKDGLVAGIKRMNQGSKQGENEFCREMELLGRLHHRHLVTLRGFCAEKQERFLIYEYLENGSLKDHLHVATKTPLNWRTRLRIAVGVAAGLEYLHCYCDPPLCHRDIKSSNILLDENFIPKIADFGLAFSARNGAEIFEPVTTDVRGTPGYMDPEYMITHELTEKSDVYSLGVLLLEIVTARRAVHDNKNLVEWAQKYVDKDSSLPGLVDPDLEHTYNVQELKAVMDIVHMCTRSEGRLRPNIKKVLRLLNERLDVDTTSGPVTGQIYKMPRPLPDLACSSARLGASGGSPTFRFEASPPVSPMSDRS